MGFFSKIFHSFGIFNTRDPTDYQYIGPGNYIRPDRARFRQASKKTIIVSIYNRIALDCAAAKLQHVKLDDSGRFVSTMGSKLNECLTVEANIDQTGRAFIQDVVESMLDEGHVVLVPTDTTVNPKDGAFDILTMRTGKVVQWYPQRVRVNVYNEQTGNREDIMLSKKTVAIVENPFYGVMNEQNSTMQRLIRKLALLDAVDEQSSSGKLDMIIQLPYVIRSKLRQEQAEERRKMIEEQLTGSKYGIAYMDGTERITQLNRPIENNLMKQVEYLTTQLFSQLGITQGILDGSADEKTMTNYYARTVEPILSAIADEIARKFLTKTARTQKQAVTFFRDPFRLASINSIADMADRFTRNEIMTSNEIRQIIGMKPADDPNADVLRNKNIAPGSMPERYDEHSEEYLDPEELPPIPPEDPEGLLMPPVDGS